MSKESQLKKSIVAILAKNKRVVGTGFIIDNHTIFTCFHIIQLADSEPGKNISVQFFCDESRRIATVDAKAWSPIEEYDVAVIRTNSALPKCAAPALTGLPLNSSGHTFYSFGFAEIGLIRGIGARGEIIDLVDKARFVQIRSQEVDHGMSGAPLYDEYEQKVIGMISGGQSTNWRNRNSITSLAVSIHVMEEIKKFGTIEKLINPEQRVIQELRSRLVHSNYLMMQVHSCFSQSYVLPEECINAKLAMTAAWEEYLREFYTNINEVPNTKHLEKFRRNHDLLGDPHFIKIRRINKKLEMFREICLDEGHAVQDTKQGIVQEIDSILAFHTNLQLDLEKLAYE